MNTKEKQINEMANHIGEKQEAGWYYLDGEYATDVFNTELAEHLYNAGYRKQEWISVEDRLPNEDDLPMNCLVVAKVGNEVVVDYATRGICWGFHSDEVETYWEILHDWDEGQGCEITHWMPMPEPPKG